MPKLPVVSAKDCIRALQKAGFYIDRQKGSHITLKRSDPPARTTVPNHRELKPGILHRVLRDADLTIEEFIELMNE
jgi:predicted RNA binding protein YcfA (HicA-like mRNA interferase family)